VLQQLRHSGPVRGVALQRPVHKFALLLAHL
jgi:hypothetical protein